MMRWGKDEMAPLIEMLPAGPGGAAVAEIGAFAGECSVQFLRSPKVAHLFVVDTWKGGYDESGRDVASRADMAAAFFAFKQRMWGVPNGSARTRVYRGTSLEAAAALSALQTPRRFDLVYLDADHSYEMTVADIRAWKPLVKPGGILAGHDHSEHWPAVIEAVKDELGGPEAIYPDSTWMVRV